MKTKLLILSMIAIAITSCSQHDQVEQIQSETQNDASTQKISFSTKTLEFKDYEDFSKTFMDLISMNEDDREQWFADKTDFVSQAQAANTVSLQLIKCKTIEEIINLRDQYTDLFVFNNDIASDDYTPHPKADELGYSMIVNAYGNVIIGGKVVNFNSITSYDQSWIGKIEKQAATKGQEKRTNYVHIWTDSRKMWVEAFDLQEHFMNGNPGERKLILRSDAQKKVCFIFCAWHSYTNDFWYRKASTRFTGITLTGIFSSNDFIFGNKVMVKAGANHNRVVQLGVITGSNITATLSVFTQGVGESNQTTLNISNPRRANFYANSGQIHW